MSVLIAGVTLFIIALITHIAIWRVRVPRRGINTLFRIFALLFIVAIIILLKYFDLSQYMLFTIFYFSLAVSYTITYSAIEADSPSVVMVGLIAETGCEGLERRDIESAIADQGLITARVADLVNDGLVSFAGDRYRIMPKGSMFVYPFLVYRKLLGLQKGG